MNENKCEKCGTIMVPYKEDRTTGMRCPNCGWGWATTLFNPIDLDQTIYTVKIDIIGNPTREQLKTFSKILNVNYLETTKLLKEGSATFSGKAIEIKDKIMTIKQYNIHYSISPAFKYDL